MYYWMYIVSPNAAAGPNSTGQFNFPTSGANTAGYILSSNGECGDLQIELGTEYDTNSAFVYINGAGENKDAYLNDIKQGFVNSTVPNNYLVVKYDGSISMNGAVASFCYEDETAGCVSSYRADVNIPESGALFIINGMSTYPVYGFSPSGVVSFDYFDFDDFEVDLDDDVDLSSGAIAGIVIGVVTFICLLCALAFCVYRCCCGKKRSGGDSLKDDLVTREHSTA